MSETTKVLVKLKTKPSTKDAKPATRTFEIAQANKLLTIKKSAWELVDENFVFNGIEIAKKTK